MNGLIYRFINWYAVRFPFPKKGLKYFISFLRKRNLSGKTFTTKNKDGILFHINLNDHIQRIIFWYGSYEPVELSVFKKLIHPGDTVFDVGANIGNYALTASKIIGKNGTVHCFEAAARTAMQLQQNVQLNSLGNITIHQCAVADKPGEVNVYLSDIENIGMTGLQPAENFSAVVEKVNAITLDDFTAKGNIKNIAIIKIDIEGSELLALQGMQQMLAQYQPILLIEINSGNLKMFNTRPAAIYHFLNELNYKPYQIIDSNTLRPVTDFTTEASLILFVAEQHNLSSLFRIC